MKNLILFYTAEINVFSGDRAIIVVLSFSFLNQHIYYIQPSCPPEPTKSLFSWGAGKLGENSFAPCDGVTGANRIFVGLVVHLPQISSRKWPNFTWIRSQRCMWIEHTVDPWATPNVGVPIPSPHCWKLLYNFWPYGRFFASRDSTNLNQKQCYSGLGIRGWKTTVGNAKILFSILSWLNLRMRKLPIEKDDCIEKKKKSTCKCNRPSKLVFFKDKLVCGQVKPTF